MVCRLLRIVPAMLMLAATGSAADEVVLRSDRSVIHATVASDELLVEQAKPGRVGAVQYGVQTLGQGRAANQAAARGMLAAGTARRVDPVVYLNGRMGDPNARAIATRRILLGAAPGQDIAIIARDHGLRLAAPVRGRPGWWIAEPLDPGVFAAVDAARTLGGDQRANLVWPLLQMPASTRYIPNDPVYAGPPSAPPNYMWHLSDVFPGIRVSEVWNTWKGTGTNLAITDTGIQTTHPDLADHILSGFSRDYFFNDLDPNPNTPDDNHGTSVAGLAAAIGDNNLGIVGVAFNSGIIASKVLHQDQPYLATDDRLREAMIVQTQSANPADLCWANNNSWGYEDSGTSIGGPGPLMLLGMEEATSFGRLGRGVPLIFAAGNGGDINPNDPQDCTAFDGYLNRFAIVVAALSDPQLTLPEFDAYKASYSESGPNITISAPGGEFRHPISGVSPRGRGMVTTDRTGDDGYVDGRAFPIPQPSDFNGDLVVVNTPGDPIPPALPFENGDYIPAKTRLAGTSLAAPLITGAAVLMQESRPDLSWRDVRQIMMHRGQANRPGARVFPRPHNLWPVWRSNAAGLLYSNWYGFGGADVGRFVFGGDGTDANKLTIGARDEPGALRWPLLPPLLGTPVRYTETFPIPPNGEPDDYAVYDAPFPSATGNANLVLDGRVVEDSIPTRVRSITMPVDSMPDRFRVDAVELTVTLRDLSPLSYGPLTYPKGNQIPAVSFYGDYAFWLTSPSGFTCILGRQRPGNTISNGGAFTWTFTEIFHTNETNIAGNWTLSILDEVDNVLDGNPFTNDPDAGNPPQVRVESVDLKIYGHQTYAQPTLSVPAVVGVASDEGDQTLVLTGSGFAVSQASVSVTQAYWDIDGIAGTTLPPTELSTTVSNEARALTRIPASLLPAASPGQAYLTIANPAIVVGRAGAVDNFDTPNVLLPTTTPAGTDRYMKRCPDTDERLIKYSRRPQLSPIPDLQLKPGESFAVSTVAFDPDVAAGLPGLPLTAETLQVTIKSFNQSFIPDGSLTVTRPPSPGNGTYSITGAPITTNTGFALIQVQATDGVLTTTRSFRVIIPTDETASGCGGGMGLALLGVPLAAWFIRRRRKA